MENFDLFTKIDLSEDSLVSPSESVEAKAENEKEAEQQATINLFGEKPVPIVPVTQKPAEKLTVNVTSKEEEAPVVPVKVVDTKAKTKTKTKAKGKSSSELAEKLKEQKKKKEDVTITPEWTIAYSAQQYHVPNNMKLEEVRQWMELDYPELSKERTTWDINEEKHLLVPIVSGAKKG